MSKLQSYYEEEQNNTDRIILWKDGMFWRAYEHSAWHFSREVHVFNTIKKSYKTLDGKWLVFIGIHKNELTKYTEKLKVVTQDADHYVFEALKPFDADDFEEWKELLPEGSSKAPGGTVFSDNDREVLRRLRNYVVVNHSPLEAMSFLSSLQEALIKDKKKDKDKES